jgi:hypothetical protein
MSPVGYFWSIKMKTSFRLFPLAVGTVILMNWPAPAQTSLRAPEFPPKEWSLWIRINLSKDLLHQFLEKKPDKNEFFHVEDVDFWLDSKGGLRAPRSHPVLTGKLPGNNRADRETIIGGGSIAHVPLKDQQSIYGFSLESVRSFHFLEEFKQPDYDASGVDLDLRLEINGRSFSIAYRKIQVQDGLPKPIMDILATLRRSLPSEYDRFFNLLSVSKLAALRPDEADKFAQCPVHSEWMKAAEVPISYGFPAPREKYWNAAPVLFPNARNYIHAGCVVTTGSPKSGQALYCASCRTAEKVWVKENESADARK